MNQWKTDRAILERRFPDLLAALAGDDSPDIAFDRTPSGQPTASIRGKQIHSSRDPEREAERLATLVHAADGPVVILGFGLGYGAEAFNSINAENPIIVVERHPELLRAALCERDLSALLMREKIAVLIGPSAETLLAVLGHFGGKPCVFANRTLYEADRVYFTELEGAITRQGLRTEVNAATLRRFGKRWVRNLGVNLPHIRDCPGIRLLEGSAKGFPAIVVAAGPSLDRILPFLSDLAERCLIIAVDTALRAVIAAGVEPDFTIVVDPQFWNARHLDRAQSPHSVLITESATYPSVLREPFRRTFLCSSLFPLGSFIEERVDPKGVLGAGGSVATTALDFARSLGASPLFVAGLDLAFPDRKTHFHGALFEERVHSEESRLSPGELRSVRALEDGHPFMAKSANGGQVLTDKRLSLYASWFAAWIERNPDCTPTSLSDCGIYIEGMKTGTVEAVSALPRCRREIAAHFEALYVAVDRMFSDMAERDRREEGYRNAVSTLERHLEKIAAVSREADDAAQRALRSLDRKAADAERRVAQAFEAIAAAERAIETSKAKPIAGFLIPTVAELEKGISRDRDDKLGWHLDFSRRLFARLAEDADYHAALIKKC